MVAAEEAEASIEVVVEDLVEEEVEGVAEVAVDSAEVVVAEEILTKVHLNE